MTDRERRNKLDRLLQYHQSSGIISPLGSSVISRETAMSALGIDYESQLDLMAAEQDTLTGIDNKQEKKQASWWDTEML